MTFTMLRAARWWCESSKNSLEITTACWQHWWRLTSSSGETLDCVGARASEPAAPAGVGGLRGLLLCVGAPPPGLSTLQN